MSNYILTAGYGWSGSSAIVDLLKEYDTIEEPNVEFRLIKDPYGLADLKYHITKNWDALTVDTAIKDFLWYADCLSRRPMSKFSLSDGLDYNKKIGSNFMEETHNFVNEIVSYSYQSDWWMSNFKKTKYEVLTRKVANKLHLKQDKPIMYFSQCTEEQFDCAAKKYLDSLFSAYSDKVILLDQAVPAQHPEMAFDFFDNAKILIVDRDPRDIYVDLINGKGLIGLELSNSHDVDKYISWHHAYRQKLDTIKKLNYVKLLQFEKTVLDYDKSVREIELFLNLSDKNHIAPKQLFNPEKSAKNIGIWKDYPYQNEIKAIEKGLSEFLIVD